VRRVTSASRRLAPASLLLALAIAAPSSGLASHAPERPASPEHGVGVFVFNQAGSTRRDLRKVEAIGFPWVKSLFR
jgi:hypothetical protein